MAEWTDDAIILCKGPFKEADVWARILCKSKGLLTVFAFGGLKSIHRFCGCLDTFNTLKCHIKLCGRGKYYNLQEASLKGTPIRLRANWRKMGIASNCLNFLQKCQINDESSVESFELLENLRGFLEEDSPISSQFPFYFRLHLASLLGFSPDFESCGLCGKKNIKENALFLPEEGRFFCKECINLIDIDKRRRGLWASPSVFEKLKLIQISPPQNWIDNNLSELDKKICGRVISAFIDYHL